MLRPAGLPFRTILALVLGSLFVGATYAPTWTVCSSGCDYTSIQNAVDGASEGDTIELGPETFHEHVTVSNRSLTIRGAGPESTVVDGGGSGTIFYRGMLGGPYALADMTIRNGTTGVGAGQIQMDNCIIRDNADAGVSLRGAGGTINNSVITGNSGGGVRFIDETTNGGSLTISGGIISNNSTDGSGGGVLASIGRYSGPELLIDSTLIVGNLAGYEGGGVYCGLCAAVISNSTVTGNTAAHSVRAGGGIFAVTTGLTIIESTITENEGGGIGVGRPWETVLKGSIVAGNSPFDCYHGYTYPTSMGHNISSDASCGLNGPGDMENTDPLLGPLADNGGPTPTHALAPGSPAIDAGGDECEPIDQRGVARPQDGDSDGTALCDIGAFELAPNPVEIDIKPGNFPNSINPRSRGVVPVALLGSEEFDVADVDVSTLRFAPDEALPAHDLTDEWTYNEHLEDVNLDGFMDLMTHFRTQETGIQCGDTEATLTGSLLDGTPFEGNDSLVTVGCNASSRQRLWLSERERLVRTDGRGIEPKLEDSDGQE
jgi:hypothetical protein